MAAVVQLEEIHKIYHSGEVPVHAVRGVSLNINKGDFVAIMGASGSGKSTLMNLLGCLDRPTKGRYLLDDTDVSKLEKNQLADIRNQKLGFVFQGFNLLSRTTALENVELPMLYGARKLTSAQMRERAQKSLELVGLGQRADHFPSQLSGGQQQLVAVARAVITKPKLLLADEPTGALHSSQARMIMDLLHELHRQGHTIIQVTHNEDYAKEAQRIVRLRDGWIDGAAAEGKAA